MIPLYAVLTASAAAFLYRALRRNEIVAPPRLIAVPTAAFLAFAALSLLWSRDIEAGANLLAFFLLPFAALVAIVARADLAPWLPRALAVIAIGLASVFAAVGLWQQATKELLFYEPELEVANAYSPFFRVTSLFTDPSLYGRHVVLGFAVLLVLLWAGKIGVALAAPLMVLLFAGLYFSYSQSSMAALFVVTPRRSRSSPAIASHGAPCSSRPRSPCIVAAGFVAVQARDESIRELTSGRWQRAELTIDVVREQPLLGVGLGAQPKVSRELGAGRNAREARFVSHTTPLTVAAELGLVGFALYVLLLLAAIRMLALLRETLPTLALALGAVLLALFTHSLAYSGFFEDPITWLTLGVGAAISRGPGACAGTGAGPRRQRDDREPTTCADQVTRREAGAVLGVLGILVAITVPELGSQAWPFQVRSGGTDPQGPFGWLVKAADRDFDIALLRSGALVAGLVVALGAAVVLARRTVPRAAVVAICAAVVGLLILPATFLQVGLRDATEPWYHVNDSTYQIEIAGDLILDGENPYGHDYRDSGLERWYPAAQPEATIPQVALDHFAYFPGTALTATAWRLLPEPFDDYRLLVLLCTLGLFGAALLFDAPFHWRLAAGAALAANPLAVTAAWFGTADAPSLLLTVLAFVFVARTRYLPAAACIAGAVLLKQFALIALPFLAVMMLTRGAARRVLWQAAALFAGIVAVGILPFAIWDPGALWDDTIAYGAQTYRIIGYGLAGVLLEIGVLDDRFGPYPFVPLAAVLWLPVTAWLLWTQWRSRRLWIGAAAFGASIFGLLYLGRVFQNSYLIWPLTAVLVAFLLAYAERDDSSVQS